MIENNNKKTSEIDASIRAISVESKINIIYS